MALSSFTLDILSTRQKKTKYVKAQLKITITIFPDKSIYTWDNWTIRNCN